MARQSEYAQALFMSALGSDKGVNFFLISTLGREGDPLSRDNFSPCKNGVSTLSSLQVTVLSNLLEQGGNELE